VPYQGTRAKYNLCNINTLANINTKQVPYFCTPYGTTDPRILERASSTLEVLGAAEKLSLKLCLKEWITPCLVYALIHLFNAADAELPLHFSSFVYNGNKN
tara:strand:+ start:1854 stop:2156 length:303 start_codon:yes stop_codon:yes gene_type:complete